MASKKPYPVLFCLKLSATLSSMIRSLVIWYLKCPVTLDDPVTSGKCHDEPLLPETTHALWSSQHFTLQDTFHRIHVLTCIMPHQLHLQIKKEVLGSFNLKQC